MRLDDLGGWSAILGALSSRRDLTAEEARAAMSEILEGAATPAQIAGFIVALRMKGETVVELTGLVEAMLAASERVTLAGGESAELELESARGHLERLIDLVESLPPPR